MSGGKDGPPGNLFAELGLAPEDVDALAQIPESEISIETLPYLIMQLKAKKARPSASTANKSDGDAPSTGPSPSGRHDSSSSTGHSHPSSHGQSKPSSSSSSSSANKGGGRPLTGGTKGHLEGHRGSWPGPPARKGENIKDMEIRLFPQGKPKQPYAYLVSDYHGDAPRTFPHTCSLCRCKVNSKMTWKDHLYGFRHESSRNTFMRLFPNWDPFQQGQSSSQYPSDSDRRPPHPDIDRRQPHPDIDRRPTHPVKRPAPRPVPPLDPMLPIKRVYQNGPPKLKTHSTHPIQRAAFRTRVVVTKFPLGSVTVKDLLELAEPFGTVHKHLVFPAKGFLEFSSYHEAQAMVSHFYDKLDFTNKHKIYIYLSPNVQCIQIPEDRDAKYTTVVFTNLPDDSKATMEKVLEIVEMFGAVRHSSINGTEAHVKMMERKDARIMVKYYGNRPLKQLGKATHVNLLAEHRDNRHQSEDSKTATTSSSSSSSSSSTAAAAAAKDKGDGAEKTGEDVRLEEKKVRAGPRGEASQPDAAWAELREEDLDPEEEEEVELGEEEEGEGGMMMEDEEEEDDGIPVEDEQGLLEDADHNLDNSTEVTEEGAEPSERANPEQASGEEDNQEEMCEFPENLDDFVTLDELDSGTDMTVTNDFGGGKVVLIRPIKGYPPKNALMKLADPFGKVVHHLISRYRQEALLQLETEEQVREMVAFYRESKESAVINGRPVTICICRTLKEIEVPSGRSVYISNLPMGKFSDVDLLTLARPYGPITAYRINRGPRACYIQFESEECASNMLKKNSRPPFRGSILTIFPCRKPDSTIPWIKVVVPLGREDRKEEENGGEEEKERRAAKRRREEGDEQGVCGDLEAEEQKTEDTEETQPDTPAGLHYIVAGFYCKLCNVFYDDETKAKTEHASSAEHHKNLRQKRKKPNA